MKLDVSTQVSDSLRQLGTNAPAIVAQAIQQGLRASGEVVTSEAKRQVYLGHPEHLKGDTGRLRQSIQWEVRGNETHVGSSVVYAAIHEFGGKTRARVIEARRAKALRFMGRGGEIIFRRRVNHPGSQIPARPYIRTALRDRLGEVQRVFAMMLKRGLTR